MMATFQEPAKTFLPIRLPVILILCLSLWGGSLEAKGILSSGPLRVMIQKDVWIHQPGCEEAGEFSLSGALSEHISYALRVKQINFTSILVDFGDPDSLSLPDSTIESEGRSLLIWPETSTTNIDGDCVGELEIRLSYSLIDPRRQNGLTRLDQIASGASVYRVDCVEDTVTAGRDNLRGGVDPIKIALREAVEELVQDLPIGGGSPDLVARPLPTVVYVDSSYLRTLPKRWLETVTTTVETASHSLTDQFGWCLEMLPPRILSAGLDSTQSFEGLFDRLRRQLPDHGDTLVVVLYNQPIGSELERESMGRMELGRAQAGRRMILLEGLPNPSDRDLFWLPLDNAICLIHEFGHALGAVHVSDVSSVMHPTATWTGSSRFDDFNRRIVKAALVGDLTFSSQIEYVRYFVKTLGETDYSLVDYPAVLAEYIQNAGSPRRTRLMRSAIGQASVLHAAEGYLLLAMGRTAMAKTAFQRAARVDSGQASLYYYLSLVVEGEAGYRLRARAARMGYYAAMGCRPPTATGYDHDSL